MFFTDLYIKSYIILYKYVYVYYIHIYISMYTYAFMYLCVHKIYLLMPNSLSIYTCLTVNCYDIFYRFLQRNRAVLRSLLQNIVSFIELFWAKKLTFEKGKRMTVWGGIPKSWRHDFSFAEYRHEIVTVLQQPDVPAGSMGRHIHGNEGVPEVRERLVLPHRNRDVLV